MVVAVMVCVFQYIFHHAPYPLPSGDHHLVLSVCCCFVGSFVLGCCYLNGQGVRVPGSGVK